MTSWVGNITLGIAIISTLLMILTPLVTRSAKRQALVLSSLTTLQATMMTCSFLSLVYAFIVTDLSIVTVALNSHTSMPLIYKISALWGNHEGSMMLWVLLSSIYTLAYAYSSAGTSLKHYAATLHLLSIINFCFFMYVMLTSNPFFTTETIAKGGQGLNPMLQDPSMAIHPPLLYIGYIGFLIPFAMGLMGLKLKTIDTTFFKKLRSWMVIPWAFLTLGITLGSLWAYYELGWGGYWFWDPVENASLMPWCLATAAIHAISISAKKGQALKWTLGLVSITFMFSILGTFITRSGLLTSVHSFANSNTRGFYILTFAAFLFIYSAYIFIRYARNLPQTSHLNPTSREGGLFYGNLLIVLITMIIAFGTFYPLLTQEASQDNMALGAPFFSKTLTPLLCILVVLMSITPLLFWSSITVRALVRRLQIPLFFLMLGVFLCLFIVNQTSLTAIALISLGLFLISSSYRTWKILGFRSRFHTYGHILAHFGFGILLVGLGADSFNTLEKFTTLKVGQSVSLGNTQFTFSNIEQREGPNFKQEIATLDLSKENKNLGTMYPEKRLYGVEKVLMSEVSLKTSWLSHYYAVLGDYVGNGKWSFRLYFHPLVSLIWIGGFLIGFAGFLSLFRKNTVTKNR